MVTTFVLGLILNLAVAQAPKLNPIGMSSEDLKEEMKKLDTDFLFNREVELKKAKILKYEDEAKTKTLVYVMHKKDWCQYYMIMYDYVYLDSIVSELDKHCEKQEENSWIELNNGVEYNKFLEKGEWYFTVITQKAEKQK